MSLLDINYDGPENPVDAIETVAAIQDWVFERSGDDEITVSVDGQWSTYQVSFSWLQDHEAVHLACGFDLKVVETRREEVVRLLARINEQMWMGHFDLWPQEGMVIYRQSLLLAGGADVTHGQIEGMLDNAIACCESYYQAVQFVVWAGQSAESALATIMFETVGEA